MKIVAISGVRNEADIIEPFVRHTLAYCDTLIVLDHGSTDATFEILKKLQQEGLSLHLLQDGTLGHMQVVFMNRLLQLAVADFAADWILPLDADEFISGRSDASFLPEPVEGVTPCLLVPMRNYYVNPADDPEVLNPVERMTRRLIVEPQGTRKAMIPRYLARQPGCRLVQGNHRLIIGSSEAPFKVLEEPCLAHYSLRSASQYAIKLATKMLQCLRLQPSLSVETIRYRNEYIEIRESYSKFAANFATKSLAFLDSHNNDAVMLDPLQYMGGPLRYTSRLRGFDDFSTQILLLGELLAVPEQPSAEASVELRGDGGILLSVEVLPLVERPTRDAQQVHTYPGRTHSLEFKLDCPTKTGELRIGFGAAPGVIEIDDITLRWSGSHLSERTYRNPELRSMLKVRGNGAAFDYGWIFAFFIPHEPVQLCFFNWRKPDEPPPDRIRLTVRYENRSLEQKFLHAKVLGAITSDRHEMELLRHQLENSLKTVDALSKRVPYIIGSTIDFSNNGDAFIFKGQGWSKTEDWGTWTDGNEATLRIRFPQIPRNDLWLNASLKAFVCLANPKMRVSVRVNGTAVEEWEITRMQFETLRALIPCSCVEGNECEIAFMITAPMSPKQAGVSGDTRLLGLGFRSIDIQETSDPRSISPFRPVPAAPLPCPSGIIQVISANAGKSPQMTVADIYGREFFEKRVPRRPEYSLVADAIARHLNFSSVLDLGCGNGFLIARLAALGKTVSGVDGSSHAIDWAVPEIAGQIELQDLTQPFSGERRDLVICSEVAEHLDACFAETLVDSICINTRGLVFFTAATPGQGGRNHVNEQPLQYWIEKFRSRSFSFDEATTDAIRQELAACIKTVRWFTRNAMVFRRAVLA